jgi:hypothetical protein
MERQLTRALIVVGALALVACGEIDLRKPRKPDPGPPPTIDVPANDVPGASGAKQK